MKAMKDFNSYINIERWNPRAAHVNINLKNIRTSGREKMGFHKRIDKEVFAKTIRTFAPTPS